MRLLHYLSFMFYNEVLHYKEKQEAHGPYRQLEKTVKSTNTIEKSYDYILRTIEKNGLRQKQYLLFQN